MKQFPQHAALNMLLEQGQFEACRVVTEAMVEEVMTQGEDLEVACLHLILSKCLFGLHEYEPAAIKANMAAVLARRAGDLGTYSEATHLAGACYGQAGNYPLAIRHFTQCLKHAEGPLHAKALYNRGHAYERLGAYAYAVPDYEQAQALQLADGQDRHLTRSAKINLAWNLILLKEFARAEAVLEQLATEPGAGDDTLLQAQLAHDRLHMAHLQGQDKAAVTEALRALRSIGQEYPHVRAGIGLSLVAIAARKGLPVQAGIISILTKRLAGQAQRPEIDEEASRLLHELEVEAGTESLVLSLYKTGQLVPGSTGKRKAVARA